MHAMPHFAVVLLLLAAAPLALADSCDPPCSSTQTCQQVFNSAAYECTEDTSDASSACDPACAAAEVCKQVFNSDAYECVAADTGAVTAPAPAAYQTNATGTASPVSATDSPAAASSSGGGSGLSGGAIAGIVIGVLVAVALIGAIAFFVVKRRPATYRRYHDGSDAAPPAMPAAAGPGASAV